MIDLHNHVSNPEELERSTVDDWQPSRAAYQAWKALEAYEVISRTASVRTVACEFFATLYRLKDPQMTQNMFFGEWKSVSGNSRSNINALAASTFGRYSYCPPGYARTIENIDLGWGFWGDRDVCSMDEVCTRVKGMQACASTC